MSAGYVLNVVGLLVVSVLAHRLGLGGRAGSIPLGRPGIKTSATVASEAAWRSAHRAAAPWLLGAALIGYALVCVCVGYPIVAPVWGWPGGLVAAAVPPVSILVAGVPMVIGSVRADRAARAAT